MADDLDAVDDRRSHRPCHAFELPPRSTARSIITEPGFIEATISR
jgi:hypothetical protein